MNLASLPLPHTRNYTPQVPGVKQRLLPQESPNGSQAPARARSLLLTGKHASSPFDFYGGHRDQRAHSETLSCSCHHFEMSNNCTPHLGLRPVLPHSRPCPCLAPCPALLFHILSLAGNAGFPSGPQASAFLHSYRRDMVWIFTSPKAHMLQKWPVALLKGDRTVRKRGLLGSEVT